MQGDRFGVHAINTKGDVKTGWYSVRDSKGRFTKMQVGQDNNVAVTEQQQQTIQQQDDVQEQQVYRAHSLPEVIYDEKGRPKKLNPATNRWVLNTEKAERDRQNWLRYDAKQKETKLAAPHTQEAHWQEILEGTSLPAVEESFVQEGQVVLQEETQSAGEARSVAPRLPDGAYVKDGQVYDKYDRHLIISEKNRWVIDSEENAQAREYFYQYQKRARENEEAYIQRRRATLYQQDKKLYEMEMHSTRDICGFFRGSTPSMVRNWMHLGYLEYEVVNGRYFSTAIQLSKFILWAHTHEEDLYRYAGMEFGRRLRLGLKD